MTEREFWDVLDEALNRELGDAGAAREKVFARLGKLLTGNAAALKEMKADARRAELKKLMVKAGFGQYWNLIQAAFDRLLALQNKHWDEHTTAQTRLARGHDRLIAYEKVRFQAFGQLGRDAVDELHKQFDRAQKENWTKTELVRNIRGISQKTEAYAESIADTSLRGWDRTVAATKAELAGIKKARYAGPPPIESSHPFCVTHYDQVYTLDEIEAMSNGQLEPVITYCGGYRCRHRWRWLIRKILKK